MIVYDLECEHNHRFEGWFGSAEDFEGQRKRKVLSCPICSSAKVVRRPSAAYVNTGAVDRRARPQPAPETPAPMANAPQQYVNIAPEIVAKVIEHIVKNTEDVGNKFPEEARKIHYNEAPERQIRGHASPKEVEALREEGIDVVPLPLPPHLLTKPH